MEYVQIDQRIKAHTPPLRPEELEQLKENILSEGCTAPLILWGSVLVDGHNRYAICREHRIEFKVERREFDGIESVFEWIENNQTGRRNLTDHWFNYYLGERYNRQKRRHGANQFDAERSPHSEDSSKTSDKLGAEHGVSGATVERAGEFAAAVDAIAEEFGDETKTEILTETKSLTQKDVKEIAKAKKDGIAFDSFKEAKEWAKNLNKQDKEEKTKQKKENRAQKEQTLAVKQQALPDKRYGVIVADPEWKFETYSENGMDRSADNHYPTSALDVIKSRDIASISAPDCVLFLWATAPMLPQALDVMKAWGFEYKSNMVWDKITPGTGYWFRNCHEQLLVGTKGKIPAPAPGTQYHSVIREKSKEHSEKPEEALEMVEDYFPNLPKIELNRRGTPRPGWDAWGNEVESVLEAAE